MTITVIAIDDVSWPSWVMSSHTFSRTCLLVTVDIKQDESCRVLLVGGKHWR